MQYCAILAKFALSKNCSLLVSLQTPKLTAKITITIPTCDVFTSWSVGRLETHTPEPMLFKESCARQFKRTCNQATIKNWFTRGVNFEPRVTVY